MLKERVFNIVWITKNRQVAFDPKIAPHNSVAYNGQKIMVKRIIQ